MGKFIKIFFQVLVVVTLFFVFSTTVYHVKLARTKSKLAAISKCIYAEKIEANGDLSSNEKLRQSLLKNYSYYYDNDKLLKDAWGDRFLLKEMNKRKGFILVVLGEMVRLEVVMIYFLIRKRFLKNEERVREILP